mmetsp:Transcript_36253/g.43757  ORF Transcript_36253/g.43757 Transcript_36253/m.43757 type:complete len:278 (+) Transcript_36253:168-1001(+)|eukprot:CAMPEP_0197846974 /NCGR_PEP_ID=MMETSP1438-20131217/4779_1 /TAXON_ID=1461541 /ORGANISM="Pterosperma sp., Strain CCMP1384" /LENGTH=277 /DNA_ID=CAMNT_0043458765 /DNA_START=168 /DNA_END=1001 /DNA_ORIENTATION=+
MVVLHCKKNNDQEFLYETTVDATVAATLKEVVAIHNIRLRIHRLKLEGEELAEYGPMKKPNEANIDDYAQEPINKSAFYKQDPTGRRTGNAADPAVAPVLKKTLDEAMAVASKDQVAKKVYLTKKMLLDAVDNIRGAVMICFPMGLPEWDNVRLALEDNEALEGSPMGVDILENENAQMWWAGKQMVIGNKLADHVGKNEKTKIVVKLTKKGAGAPQRESPIDATTQKEMMAFYYKKQEEQKKLEDNEDDDYHNSAWANPGGLKAHFAGTSGGIKFR